MKITEAKLRKMIRGVIREFTSGATAAGASKDTGQSADKASKQADYDAKKSTRAGVSAVEPKTAGGTPKVYQRPSRKGGYDYRATSAAGYSKNAAYTTWESNKARADAEEADALTALNKAKADLQAMVPREEPPAAAAGTGGYGTGKSAGKGKGKKGKKKD